MRKYIILTILFSCLHIAARGQTIASLDDIDLSGLPKATKAKALRYWYDDDGGNVKTVTQLKGKQSLDVSALTEGLHTLYYQVVDEANALSPASSAVFLRLGNQTAGTTPKQLRYWFDDNGSSVQTVAATNGVHTIDANALVDGLHTLHYQVIGADGSAYCIASSLFLKMNDNSTEEVTARKLMYWFDDETDIKAVDVAKGVQLLDASPLTEGLHTIHYQVLCSNGEMTSSKSSIFLRMNTETEATTAKSLRYWFDNEQTVTETAIASGAQAVDASRLLEGLHTLHYQIVDSRSALCAPVSAVFLKMNRQVAASKAKSIRYWFDDDKVLLKVTGVSQGTQQIDATSLVSGLHTLYYQLVDDGGSVSPPVAVIFMKDFDKVVADGKNRVTKYQYWLNSNSQAMNTVELANAANPYQLISLLPMQKEPIHSDCFHFEMTNGQPTVYAKNIFHIRFHDAAGYFSDGDRPFVDYSVKQDVTDAELLNNGDHKDTARPVGDDIKWYRLTAEPGDSVQFRLNRAATVQLFAPSGEEILSASASEVVKWFGCHVRESGTYYLALHNVTATQGTTVGIDYEHIDKYAVLRQDVALVGNGGCSTITFEGNGFRDLYAVDLFTAQGDSVHHIYIGHESDASTSVVFDFTDAALGTYHAKFRFAEEDKVFNNLVTVEEARDIELATTVTYPSTFLSGTSTTYTIKITNKGNMTAYYVPIYTYIQNISEEGIKSIKYDGLDLVSYADVVNNDSLSEKDREIINKLSEMLRDAWHFAKFKVPNDSNDGDSMTVRSNYFFTNISPNSTKELTLTINSHEDVTVYFTVPPDWNELTEKDRSNQDMIDRYCCIRDGVECFVDLITSRLDVASVVSSIAGYVATFTGQVEALPVTAAINIADCVAGIGSTALKTFGFINCGLKEAKTIKEIDKETLKTGQSFTATILGCLGGALGTNANLIIKSIGESMGVTGAAIGNYGHYAEMLKSITLDLIVPGIPLGTLYSIDKCTNKLITPKPGCPHSDPQGGKSNNVISLDPNDIFGYTAESSSHAVKDGLTDVYYRIEFENDTAFATASAHDIYVTDTLDARKFDLSTFRPTRVKIGEKSAELSGDKNFVTTIDMRPGINAIAQVEGTYDEKKGIAKWHISSLDPMTMEPTKYVMDGVLPVNIDGRGIGEVMYDIKLKSGLAHGTEIKNRAGIVFDTNDVIMTPTWTNTIDRVKPTSRVVDAELLPGGETAAISITASDEGSGPWRYNVYVQYGSGAWFLAAENVPADTTATVKLYDGIVHHFYCVATDMAGNVEQKEARSEVSFYYGDRQKGDVNGDGKVSNADLSAVIYAIAGTGTETARTYADVNGDGIVNVADIVEIIGIIAAKAAP